MLTDIEIAQQNKMEKIQVIADKCGLTPDDIEQYGHYKAKISFDAIKRLENKKDGKLVLVTAITPTPAGEGKSTTTIGLVQALNKINLDLMILFTFRKESRTNLFDDDEKHWNDKDTKECSCCHTCYYCDTH